MKSIKVSKDKYLDYYNSYVQEKFKKLKYKSGFNAFISQYDDKKEQLNIIANGIHNAAGQNFYIILKSLFTNTSNNLVDTGTTDTIEFTYSSSRFYFYDSTSASVASLVPNVSITDNNGVKYTTSNITSAIANPTNLTLSILIPANSFTGSSISSITLYSNAGAITITYSNITPPTNTINPALATTINLVFSDML
jgi:hypothetical protein